MIPFLLSPINIIEIKITGMGVVSGNYFTNHKTVKVVGKPWALQQTLGTGHGSIGLKKKLSVV